MIGSGRQSECDDHVNVGTVIPGLGGSEYCESVQGLVGGQVPRANLRTERIIMRTMTRIVKAGLAEAAHDISKGGLAVSLPEMAIQGQKRFTASLDDIPANTNRIAPLLFSKSYKRFIL